jgi:hypothetical protein
MANDPIDYTDPVGGSTWSALWPSEDNYWRENFSSRPYALDSTTYEQFRPAYRYGVEAANHHMGRRWEEAEPDLRKGWEGFPHRGGAAAVWESIRDAVKDAWDRVAGRHEGSAASEDRMDYRTTNG